MLYALYLESRLSLYLFMYGYKICIDNFKNIIFDKNKLEYLEEIIGRILNKALKLNVAPHEIYVTKNGFLPDEFTHSMIKSYNNFISPKIINNKDIYNISLCHNVFMNRKRLLYRDCFDMFDINKKIYADIDIFCNKYNTHNIYIKKVIDDKERLISGELDMYDETEKKIIDFKTSINDKIQIEWILQLLSYTALMRLYTKNVVDIISIYNPLSGLEYIIDIKNWHKEKELLNLLKKVRDELMELNSNIKNTSNEQKKYMKDNLLPKKKNKNIIKQDILFDGLDGLDEDMQQEYNKLMKNKK